ncbi:hypothetical protein ACK3TF_003925 [Chlorella vulgaris]
MGVNVSEDTAARVAHTVDIHKARQRITPALRSAHIGVRHPGHMAKAVKMRLRGKVEIPTPQQLPASGSSSEWGQLGSNKLPLLRTIIGHVDATHMQVVPAPAHRHGNVATISSTLDSSLTANNGQISRPAMLVQAPPHAHRGEEGEVVFLEENVVVPRAPPLGARLVNSSHGGWRPRVAERLRVAAPSGTRELEEGEGRDGGRGAAGPGGEGEAGTAATSGEGEGAGTAAASSAGGWAAEGEGAGTAAAGSEVVGGEAAGGTAGGTGGTTAAAASPHGTPPRTAPA